MSIFIAIVFIQAAKTELVMRILLRLVEDVIMFNTLKPQRRKDIQTALNSAVINIVPFLVETLESNIQAYKSVSSRCVMGWIASH